MMKKLMLMGLLGACAFAEEEKKEVEYDMEARRQSVVTMREHIEMREKRLKNVVDDLKRNGDDIDERIGKIVASLSKLKDSQSSKTRISTIKAEAAKGLVGMIEFYQAERRRLVEQGKRDEHAPIESMAKIVQLIDKRIETRAAEVVKLVNSIPGAKDVKKYEGGGGGDYYGGYGRRWGSNERISETWRQNRRDGVQSNKARRDAQKALEESIENLERRRDYAKTVLKRPGLSETEKAIQEYELEHTEDLIKSRRKQLVEVTAPSHAEGTQTTSKDEADDIRQLFHDAVDQLQEDFNDNMNLYRKAKLENEKLHKVKENLAARIKWLEEHDPEWKDEGGE